ncbi:MAG: dihydrolipoamide acetyltransferase family protein, partial [Nitrospinota bacterium]
MPEHRISMPRMGTSVHEGTVVQWLKEEGSALRKGEPLLLAESEKVEFEVESPCSGRLARILVPADTTVSIGQALAVIETEEAVSADEGAAAESVAPAVPPSVGRGAVRSSAPGWPERRDAFLSPRVRRLAAERGIPLDEVAAIAGTGEGGRVTEEDLRTHLAGREAPPPEGADVVPLGRLRKRLSRRLSALVREVPQFTTFDEADVTAIVAGRKALGEASFARKGIHLTYTHFVAWAVLRALERAEFRPLNAQFGGDVMYLFREVHLGIAVAVPEGLLVPVIRNAASLSFEALAGRIQDLADRARQGVLSPEDVTGGTFTITNAGAGGSLYSTPILNPPEAAILAVGAIRKRAVPLEDGSVGVRDRMGVSLTVDHRVADGAEAAQFLMEV